MERSSGGGRLPLNTTVGAPLVCERGRKVVYRAVQTGEPLGPEGVIEESILGTGVLVIGAAHCPGLEDDHLSGGPLRILGHGGRLRILGVTFPSWFVTGIETGPRSSLGWGVKMPPPTWPLVIFTFHIGKLSVTISPIVTVMVVVVTWKTMWGAPLLVVVVVWPTSKEVT